MLILLGALFTIASLVCWVILTIAAFKDEIWKGLVGLLCGLYMLYYGIVEFQHEQKWLILAGAFLGGAIGTILIRAGGFGSSIRSY